ncbi:MAG: hypothetical protein J1F41_01410 [Lachnospiraceae bacterium]|nr:hypothetical protein [Lachnospiraceae bacterium]
MMYMHYCKCCHRIHMLNGHKRSCPNCSESITELKVPYMEYVSMNREKRDALLTRLADEAQLQDLSTTYRMYKYSKWYKELHGQIPGNAIITYTLTGETQMNNAVSVI